MKSLRHYLMLAVLVTLTAAAPDARTGSTVQCRGDAVPPGWVTVDRHWRAMGCGDGSPSRPNARVIASHRTHPAGSRIQICVDAPTPAGWVEVDRFWRARNQCLAGASPSRPNLKRIEKLVP